MLSLRYAYQKGHCHPTCTKHPETTGPMKGPIEATTMNQAIDLPLHSGSSSTSANSPPVKEIGAAPNKPTTTHQLPIRSPPQTPHHTTSHKPVKSLKITNPAQPGATAHPAMNPVYTTKLPCKIPFRPKCSLSGAQSVGPMT